jgi:hypothetical protein
MRPRLILGPVHGLGHQWASMTMGQKTYFFQERGGSDAAIKLMRWLTDY